MLLIWEGESLSTANCPDGRLANPLHGEVTNRDRRGG
jgi:hypothetical protein